MSKLKRNSPVPMVEPKHTGKGDEETDAEKKGSTIVGQPELTGKDDPQKINSRQLNDRKNGSNVYTD
jgi:hypothetical protein